MVIGRWQANQGLDLLVGCARFFAGAYVRGTRSDAPDANRAFAQLTWGF